MSQVKFHQAKRGDIGLLLMLAGGTGSGKTWSAMELAKGMAGGKRFCVCDTERGRASMYADTFDFDVFELEPPFSPERYQEVLGGAEDGGYPVVVIDSMSHEWEGPGGMLDEHERLMGGKESKNLQAWIAPKMAHRRFVNYALQVKPHVIMCFRAAERVETSRDSDGRLKIIPKRSLTGLNGWVPISERTLPFEATASFLLMPDKPGTPLPIKLPTPLQPLVPLDTPLTAETGAALARWAAGTTTTTPSADVNAEADALAERLIGMSSQPDETRVALDRKRQELRAGEFIAFLNAKLAERSAA